MDRRLDKLTIFLGFVKFASASEPFLEDAQSQCIRSLSQDISQGISQDIFTARVMSGFCVEFTFQNNFI